MRFAILTSSTLRLTLLDRHLIGRLCIPLTLTLFTFMTAGVVGQLLRVLTRPESYALPLLASARLALLALPGLTGMLLPAAFLTAVLITFARLAEDGELTALEASGHSPWRLTAPLLLASLVITAISAFAQLEGEPWARRQLRNSLAALQGAALTRPRLPGSTLSPLPGFTLIRTGQDGSGLLLADDRGGGRHSLVLARAGALEYNPRDHALRVHLQDGISLEAGSEGDYQRLRFDHARLEFPLQAAGTFDLAALSSGALHARIAHLKTMGATSVMEELTLARRWALPLACPAFALLAMPLTRPHSRSRAPRPRAYLLAIGLLLLHYLLLRGIDAFASHVVAASPPPVVSPAHLVWLPDLLLALLGIALLQRRSRRC